ncbi:hypothetical protein ACFQVC_08520 [Streptomyces monticola]|uniref:Uncharacterized protein n=1 Tax=Streptomyces monticola TaxID=2666263 RepID=A0ABW2JFD0_9ACTN
MLEKLFWSVVGIAVLFATAGALLSYGAVLDGDTTGTLVSIGLVAEVPMLVLSVFVSRKKKRERRARYERMYPTSEAVWLVADRDAVRAARDAKGNAHAIRTLRKQAPGIPLAEAAKLVLFL